MNEALKLAPITEVWEPTANFTILEAVEGDNKSVLARVRGDFFVPDGTSRNKRFYPRGLWEKVCANGQVQRKLKEKLMFGTIGHGQKIDDFTLLEGKMSHIVTNLTIEGNQGIGEALILDTPAGRILNTVLRAGSVLRVSSRANGTFKGEQNGVPIVDPDSYILETFDFVIDPGFFQANPKLVESLEEMLAEQLESSKTSQQSLEQGDNVMETKQLLENLGKELASAKADLEKATGEVETLKNENVILADKAKHLEADADKAKKLEASNTELTAKLAVYEALGTAEEVKALTESTGKFIKEVGTFEDATKKLSEAKVQLDAFLALGGSPERLAEAMHKSLVLLVEYRARGSLEELDGILATFEKQVAENKESKRKEAITALAKELNVDEAKISKLYGKVSDDEIRETFKDMKAEIIKKVDENKIKDTFSKKIDENKDKPAGDPKPGMFEKDAGTRLFESFTK